MFSKLRTVRYLKTSASVDFASVQFESKVQHIARVHHYGLRDRVSHKGPKVRYTECCLRGVNDKSYVLTLDILNRFLLP